jgi:hypothetical protein
MLPLAPFSSLCPFIPLGLSVKISFYENVPGVWGGLFSDVSYGNQKGHLKYKSIIGRYFTKKSEMSLMKLQFLLCFNCDKKFSANKKAVVCIYAIFLAHTFK